MSLGDCDPEVVATLRRAGYKIESGEDAVRAAMLAHGMGREEAVTYLTTASVQRRISGTHA